MSTAPPKFVPGPREVRIQKLWDDVWQAYSSGEVHEPIIALAESELAGFRESLPPNDPASDLDFRRAQNVQLFQSKHFLAHLGKIEAFREQVRWSLHQVYDQTDKSNQNAIRALSLANGGVVVATLAYVQSKTDISINFIYVIALCAVGYLLTILGSHVSVILSTPLIQLMSDLLTPRQPEAVRTAKLVETEKRTKRLMKATRPIFYASAVCLVFALVIGVYTLARERNLQTDHDKTQQTISTTTELPRSPK